MGQLTSHSKKPGLQVFGTFFLAESEFAVDADVVQEVVVAPPAFTPVPLMPNYLKGLFNLRGAVIPVLDLGVLLQLRSNTPPESQKIAIVEVEGSCVGLLFDQTGEIFKSSGEDRSDFNTSDHMSVISGVFKKDNGARIIQIINVANIYKLQNIPKDVNRNRLGRSLLSRKASERRQCISFVVGPAQCALEISNVQEIIRVDRIDESALSGGFCIGAINLRSTTVPVVDFAALLKYRDVDGSDKTADGDRRIIIMRLEKALFGLLVDSVANIVSFFPEELISFPLVDQNRRDMFLGCISRQGETEILLLEHQRILSDTEVHEITKGHSRIYQSTANENEKAKALKRGTYITFAIDGTYAIPISAVKEIIEYPNSILRPPGMKPYVRGVLNLRGNLTTIIDTRAMYTSKETSPATADQPKVLIFHHSGLHFGLIVDSIDAIVTVNEHEKIRLPEMLYHQGEGTLSTAVSEAIEVTDTGGAKKNLLILNVESIAQTATMALAG